MDQLISDDDYCVVQVNGSEIAFIWGFFAAGPLG